MQGMMIQVLEDEDYPCPGPAPGNTPGDGLQIMGLAGEPFAFGLVSALSPRQAFLQRASGVWSHPAALPALGAGQSYFAAVINGASDLYVARSQFAFPYNNTILHAAGGSWSTVRSLVAGKRLGGASHPLAANAVYYVSWGSPDFLLGVEAWNGSAWSTVTHPHDFFAIFQATCHAQSSSNVWVAGARNNLGGAAGGFAFACQVIGSAANTVLDPDYDLGGYGVTSRFEGIYAASPTDVWAVGQHERNNTDYGGVFYKELLAAHYDGTGWTNRSAGIPLPPFNAVGAPFLQMYDVHGTSGSDIWACGSYQDPTDCTRLALYHYNGTSWSLSLLFPQYTAEWFSVQAISPTDAWLLGVAYSSGPDQWLLAHWNGTTWTLVPVTY